ncbi:unnamed protein product, partial [Rangifer tarandus platyrhynchus]
MCRLPRVMEARVLWKKYTASIPAETVQQCGGVGDGVEEEFTEQLERDHSALKTIRHCVNSSEVDKGWRRKWHPTP